MPRSVRAMMDFLPPRPNMQIETGHCFHPRARPRIIDGAILPPLSMNDGRISSVNTRSLLMGQPAEMAPAGRVPHHQFLQQHALQQTSPMPAIPLAAPSHVRMMSFHVIRSHLHCICASATARTPWRILHFRGRSLQLHTDACTATTQTTGHKSTRSSVRQVHSVILHHLCTPA